MVGPIRSVVLTSGHVHSLRGCDIGEKAWTFVSAA
jgi:hypothetical protein